MELKQGATVEFEHGDFKGLGIINGIHYQYVGNREEPYVYYIVETDDIPDDMYGYKSLLVPEANVNEKHEYKTIKEKAE